MNVWAQINDNWRIIRHPAYEKMRGEFELQSCDTDGDYQNVAFSHDIAELGRIALTFGEDR